MTKVVHIAGEPIKLEHLGMLGDARVLSIVAGWLRGLLDLPDDVKEALAARLEAIAYGTLTDEELLATKDLYKLTDGQSRRRGWLIELRDNSSEESRNLAKWFLEGL